MNANIATIQDTTGVSIIGTLASHYGMDRQAFIATMKKTVMGGKEASNEQIAAFCLVAKEHGLNPFTKEIFAFPANGGIIPVVSVDGWLKLINEHPAFDGMEFVDEVDDKKSLVSVTCKMYRKDRAHPVIVTEYMAECVRGTDTWKKWPARMLRHKATIQAARYAFGFAGIVEPDEAERMAEPVRAVVIEMDQAGQDFIAEANAVKTFEEYEVLKVRAVAHYGSSGKIPPDVISALNAAKAETAPRD